MKFSAVLAIAFCVVAVSAAPHYNREDNREDNSRTENKQLGQSIGDVGSTTNHGLLGGLLGGGINVLSPTTNVNKVGQNGQIN